jgi:hypothetical protein
MKGLRRQCASGEALDQLPHRLVFGMAEDEEILAWNCSDVEAFTECEPAEEVARVIRRLVEIGGDHALGVLCGFLAARGPGLDDKPAPSQLAVRGLVLSGPAGIDALGKAIRVQRVRYRAKVLVVLIRVAEGKGLTNPMGPLRDVPDDFLDESIPAGTAEATQRMLSDIASEAVADVPDALNVLAGVLSDITMFSEEDGISEGGERYPPTQRGKHPAHATGSGRLRNAYRSPVDGVALPEVPRATSSAVGPAGGRDHPSSAAWSRVRNGLRTSPS